MKNKTYFKLHANCIPVKGAKRSVICDLQRKEVFFINEGLFEVLTVHQDRPIEDIKTYYGHWVDDRIEEQLEELVSHELGIYCEDPRDFPPLSTNWEVPSLITNAILEYGRKSVYDLSLAFEKLTELNTKFLELRFYEVISHEFLTQTLEKFRPTSFKNISIFLKYHEELDEKELGLLLVKEQRVGNFIVHSAPFNRTIRSDTLPSSINYLEQTIQNNDHCGIIDPAYFSINPEMFFESLRFNSCLNRKLAIDPEGQVRNCPSLPEKYGHIEAEDLRALVLQKDFQQYWKINKDQIRICQDCEFRYICSDCRAFVEGDRYSKPSQCQYDPYTATYHSPTTS